MTSGGYLTVVKRDGSFGQSYLIENDSRVIGTASSCHIKILQNNKKQFAPRQCVITVHPTETIIKNLSFETPTFVNDDLFATKVLINGDIITFGGVTFKWEYFNMGPRSNIPVRKSKAGPKREAFPIIKTKGSIGRRKSEIPLRRVDLKLKRILDTKARSSLSALSAGSFTSNNRQVAVVKPQRRNVENSNDDEAVLEVPIFSNTNARTGPDNVLSGRRQSKRSSTVSSPTYFQSSVPKKRKTNEVKKLDSPVVLDDHKKAALLMLTRTPGNRALNKPLTPISLPSQPKAQEKVSTGSKPKLVKSSVKKTPSVSSTSKIQLKPKISNTRIAKSAPPKSLIQQRTEKVTRSSLVSAKKVLLPSYSQISRNTTPKLTPRNSTTTLSTRQSGIKASSQVLPILEESPLLQKKIVSVPSPGILKNNSSAPSSPRKSVAFESIPSPRTRNSIVLPVISIETPTQTSKIDKSPKTPILTPGKSKTITPKGSLKTTPGKRQSSRISPSTVSNANTPVSTPKDRKSNVSATSASKSTSSVSITPLKLRSSPSPKSTSSKISPSPASNKSQSKLNSPSPKRKSVTPGKSLNVRQSTGKSPDQSIDIISPLSKTTLRTPSSTSINKPASNISPSPKSKTPNVKTVTLASNSRSTRQSSIQESRSSRSRSSIISSSLSKPLSAHKITPTRKSTIKPIATPYSTPSIRKNLLSKITSSKKAKVATPVKKLSPAIEKTPSPKSRSPSTMVTPVNRSLRNASFVISTPRSGHKGVSRISLARESSAFKSGGKSKNEISIRALNLSDLFSDAQGQNTPASTPLPKRKSRVSGSMSKSNRKLSNEKPTRLSRQSNRASDSALSLSPIPSPRLTRSPKTPTSRSPNVEAINTTPEVSKLFELEASTPKEASRRSSRGLAKSSDSPISSRKRTRLSQFSKTEPRKQIAKKSSGGARKSLNLARKSGNVTPKSKFKLIPEILKEKHSTAKKSLSKKFLIESRSEQKDVFSSPLRRKLSQSLRQDSTTLADDLENSVIANASFELLHGHSIDDSKRLSSSKLTRMSLAKSKTPSPSANKISLSGNRKSLNVSKNKSLISKSNRSSRIAKSPRNSSINISGVKQLFGTPTISRSPKNNSSNTSLKATTPKSVTSPNRSVVKNIISPRVTRSPKNDLSNVSGGKKLLKTPKPAKSPKNDLTNVSGVKRLLKTPKPTKSPKNDLRNVAGVKRLLRTPKPAKSPKNDLRNVAGVKQLLKTPKPAKSPKNDLRNVAGIKRLLKTPKVGKSPKNDLTNVAGVKHLLKTPKVAKSPKNDLRNVSGVKRLLKTPKTAKSPKNDLSNVSGVKRLLKTPKLAKSPKNDLRNISGIKSLLKTPKPAKSPKNDLRNVSGVKRLLKTPKPVKSPKNDLSNVSGVKKLLKTPKSSKSPNLSGIKLLVKTPKSVRSKTQSEKLQKSPRISPKTTPVKKSPIKTPSSPKSAKKLPTINTSAFYKKPKASLPQSPKSPNKSRTNVSKISISILGHSTPAKGIKGKINNLSIGKFSPIKTISSPAAKTSRALRKRGPVGIKKKSPVKKIKVTKQVKQELIAIAQTTKGKRGKTINSSPKKLSPSKAVPSPPAKTSRASRKKAPVGIKKKSPVKKIKVTKQVKQQLIAAAKKTNPIAVVQSMVSKKSSLKIDPENSFISVRGRRGQNKGSISTSITSPSPKKNNEDKKKVTFASDVTTESTDKPVAKTRNSKRQAGTSASKASEVKKKAVPAKSKASETKKKATSAKSKVSETKKKTVPAKSKVSEAKKKAASPVSEAKKKATPAKSKVSEVKKKTASTKSKEVKKKVASPAKTAKPSRSVESKNKASPKSPKKRTLRSRAK